jgi:hypothetical protein
LPSFWLMKPCFITMSSGHVRDQSARKRAKP